MQAFLLCNILIFLYLTCVLYRDVIFLLIFVVLYKSFVIISYNWLTSIISLKYTDRILKPFLQILIHVSLTYNDFNGGNSMANINGNIPSLKNSKSVNQAEIQNVKQNINSTAGKNTILGAELTSNISNAASLGNMTSSVPSLNSSTSVGSKELQNVKNTVQNSGNSKKMF